MTGNRSNLHPSFSIFTLNVTSHTLQNVPVLSHYIEKRQCYGEKLTDEHTWNAVEEEV